MRAAEEEGLSKKSPSWEPFDDPMKLSFLGPGEWPHGRRQKQTHQRSRLLRRYCPCCESCTHPQDVRPQLGPGEGVGTFGEVARKSLSQVQKAGVGG